MYVYVLVCIVTFVCAQTTWAMAIVLHLIKSVAKLMACHREWREGWCNIVNKDQVTKQKRLFLY